MPRRALQPTAVREIWREDWRTGPEPEGMRKGLFAYTHMLRAPDDPERSDRKRGETHVIDTFHKGLDVAAAKAKILAHLADGQPRTFNRICIELWDVSADIIGDAMTDALFELCADGKVQHTLEAPILWLPVWQGEELPPLLPRPPQGTVIRRVKLSDSVIRRVKLSERTKP